VKTKNAEQPAATNYTITLDSDPNTHLANEEILGITSISFTNPQSLLESLGELSPIAAFIEISLSQSDAGVHVVPEIKLLWPSIPVIAVSHIADESAVASMFMAGADDYVRKPYSREEFLIRFGARKKQLENAAQADRLKVGDSVLNLSTRELMGPLGKIYLSPTEQSILKFLVESKEEMVSRDLIKRKCWGNQTVSNNALDRHIHGVKTALKSVSANMKMRAVYGQGYLVQHVTKGILLAS
jgi:DNA-binding response OmpR family regulator